MSPKPTPKPNRQRQWRKMQISKRKGSKPLVQTVFQKALVHAVSLAGHREHLAQRHVDAAAKRFGVSADAMKKAFLLDDAAVEVLIRSATPVRSTKTGHFSTGHISIRMIRQTAKAFDVPASELFGYLLELNRHQPHQLKIPTDHSRRLRTEEEEEDQSSKEVD
ncbi:MAG: hypothetical protein Q7R47_00685 [Candidatus Diapherotrites archaeon]|nr:hypothetical protein [Candidatus Diapherotrites archaeon]